MSPVLERAEANDREAARSAGQALNALRRTVTRTCGVCGIEITGVSTIKWCSPRCAKRHERALKRARGTRVAAFLKRDAS